MSSNAKLFFLIGSYPSDRSPNVLCDEQIIKKLSEKQYNITCLVTKSFNTKSYEKIGNIEVYRLYRSWFYNLLFWAKENNDCKISKIVFLFDRILLRTKQLLYIAIYPSYTPNFSKRMANKAIKLYKKEKYDMIIAEYFSFESLFAGYKVKKKYPEVTFIPILWDPISGGYSAKYLPKRYCDYKTRKCEETFLSVADKIVAMKSSQKYHMKHNTNTDFSKKIIYLDNPRIIEYEHYANEKNDFIEIGRINIVFAGKLITPERDPSYILKLFNRLDRDDITLIFFGDGNGFDIINKVKKVFKGHIITPGYVPYSKLINVFKNANYFLNLGCSYTTATASKIFDYMSYGKPIITTFYTDSDPNVERLKKYPLSLSIDQRLDDIDININKLKIFLETSLNKQINFDEVKTLFWENTPDAYVELVDSTLKQKFSIKK